VEKLGSLLHIVSDSSYTFTAISEINSSYRENISSLESEHTMEFILCSSPAMIMLTAID
jgi:hypothetical protein